MNNYQIWSLKPRFYLSQEYWIILSLILGKYLLNEKIFFFCVTTISKSFFKSAWEYLEISILYAFLLQCSKPKTEKPVSSSNTECRFFKNGQFRITGLTGFFSFLKPGFPVFWELFYRCERGLSSWSSWKRLTPFTLENCEIELLQDLKREVPENIPQVRQ